MLKHKTRIQAFSLVEVVIALAICALALLPMVALLSEGLTLDLDSKEELQAANLSTLMVVERLSSPTNSLPNVLLPPFTNSVPANPVTTYVDLAGHVTTPALAVYQLNYQVGTNLTTPGLGLIYMRFTWPPAANPNTAPGQYELTTQVSIPQ